MKKQQNSENQAVSSNISSIDELAKKQKEELNRQHIKTLEENNVGLAQTVEKLMNELSKKEEEIQHLTKLLGSQVPVVGKVETFVLTDEELIAIKQLDYLKRESAVRPLTLDEIKKYDLLVKNKRLAEGNATAITKSKSDLKNLPLAKVIEMASQPIVAEIEE